MFRRNRVASHRPLGLRRRNTIWPVALAIVVRLAVWLVVPATRFASDEDSYFQVGTAILVRGEQDLFWPPLTGWLIALVRWALHTDAVSAVRLVWIAMDIGCVLAVRTLAGRMAPAVSGGDEARAARFVTLATLGYALYLPAISHAQFATSETPALLQTLLVLVLLTRLLPGAGTYATAGFLTGTLTLTRPSLLPMLVLLPMATELKTGFGKGIRRALIFFLAGVTVIGAHLYRNWVLSGELTIARNSAYNLYIGNRDMYGEDLNLFSPRATSGQIEFRRQQWSGELVYPSLSAAELQREAFAWIRDHPGVFARRAIGRLARVFVPKTDVLELAGGERQAGIFSPVSLALLGIVNIQWAFVLFGGVLGLAALRRTSPSLALLFASTITGALLLCLIAISKPRYSFVFDPVLILGAVVFFSAPREAWSALGRRDRAVVGAVFAFLLWAWTAWLIFSLTSRAAL